MPPYGNHGRRFGSGANAGRTNQHWNNQPAEQEASFANAVPLGDPNQTLDNAHGDDSISHGLDSLSSSSEEEDETGDLMTPDVDLQIFKAIGAIRNKDQRLYDDKSNFFSAEELRKSRQEWEAKLKARELERKRKGADVRTNKPKAAPAGTDEASGTSSDSSSASSDSDSSSDSSDDSGSASDTSSSSSGSSSSDASSSSSSSSSSDDDDDSDAESASDSEIINTKKKATSAQDIKDHQRTQEELKRALLRAADGEDDEEEAEDFLAIKTKTSAELEREEDDYKEFLLENINKDDNAAQAFRDWSNADEKGPISADDKFLMDYILNQNWKGGDKPKKGKGASAKLPDDDEDEEEVEVQEEFEDHYNHRFDDGTKAFHALPINESSSVRRKDNRRKLARQRVAQRKLEEKQAKLKELARLRAEKKREIWDRLQTIREITGNKTAGFDDLDLDGEFDPEKHEAMMGKLLENDEDQFGEGGEGPGEKPVWDDEDYGDYGDLEEDGSASRSTKKLPVGDDDFIMDADYLPGGDNYDGSEAPAPPNKKPKKMASDAMDDVYDLGYEDIIDGMPTRFKYQKVEKEDFGLSAVDILLANEDELNAYVDQNAFSPYLNPDVPSHRFTPREEDRARLQNRLNQKISTLPENAEEAESMPITLFGKGASRQTRGRGRGRGRGSFRGDRGGRGGRGGSGGSSFGSGRGRGRGRGMAHS